MKKLSFASVLVVALMALPSDAFAQGFARTIGISGDELLIGEPQFGGSPGVVYVYGRSGDGWEETGRIMSPTAADGDGFGFGVAVSGDQMLVASVNPFNPGLGGIYSFSRGADGWTNTGVTQATGLPEGMML